MLEKIRVRRRSNEVISIGDVVNYRKATFVVINILSIKVVPRATGEFIYYDCLCQQLQTPDLSAEYMTTQAEIMYQPHEFREVSEVGEFIYDESTGIWVQIDAILNVRFEDKNMYVKYEFAPVVEWSNKEMQTAVVKQRRKCMKLLKPKTNNLVND